VAFSCPKPEQTVAPNPHCFPIAGARIGIFLTVQGCTRLVVDARGATEVCESFEMIETVSALMGLLSAGIFLAHAFEGYRTRA
jgi:hypothetical protein